MRISLKLCYNIKDLKDVRDFFFARFKRALYQKSVNDKL